jgi:hypothetical protein
MFFIPLSTCIYSGHISALYQQNINKYENYSAASHHYKAPQNVKSVQHLQPRSPDEYPSRYLSQLAFWDTYSSICLHKTQLLCTQINLFTKLVIKSSC